MTNRYHVQVRVRESGNKYAWRRVRPTGGDPYVFTGEEAENYIRNQWKDHHQAWGNYRLEPLPE
jgi:ribosomal protein L25 (general stress protein Ctc)